MTRVAVVHTYADEACGKDEYNGRKEAYNGRKEGYNGRNDITEERKDITEGRILQERKEGRI